jgi:molybdopterin-guanine dinucleotide biosynthesis protein
LERVDLVLVEGYKGESLPKLQVVRAAHDARLLPDDGGGVVGFAADDPGAVTALAAGRPVFALDAVSDIATFVFEQARLLD